MKSKDVLHLKAMSPAAACAGNCKEALKASRAVSKIKEMAFVSENGCIRLYARVTRLIDNLARTFIGGRARRSAHHSHPQSAGSSFRLHSAVYLLRLQGRFRANGSYRCFDLEGVRSQRGLFFY